MKSILRISIILFCMAVAIATPYRRNEELHLKSSSVDLLRSQESRWGWGDRGVGGFEARGEAAGIAAAGNFDVDGFGGRREFEIEAAREAGADFTAGGYAGGW